MTTNLPDKKPVKPQSDSKKLPELLSVEVTEEYQGLIPHPRLMAWWEQVVPGSASKLFERFHTQSDHRMTIETRVVRANNFKQYSGPVFAFFVSMTAIIGGLIVALKGLEGIGGTLSFTGLATLVAPFLYSTFRAPPKIKDRDE